MSLPVQFYTLLTMIAMGSLFGVMLDTYQRFLMRSRRKRWIVFINDLLFWLIQGILIFYVLFQVNDGELRFYLFLALLCGFSAYQALFKNIYMGLLNQLIQWVQAMIRFGLRMLNALIYQPLKGLYLLIVTILLYIGKTLLALVNLAWKVIEWVLNIIFKWIKWSFRTIYLFFPKPIKKNVGKVRNLCEGFFVTSKNTIIKGYAISKKFFRKK